MKTFLAVFTRDWALKLLALALAVIVYYTMRGKTDDSALFLRRSDFAAEVPAPVKPPPAPTLTPDVPEGMFNVK